MRSIITGVIAIICVVIGSAGAHFLKTSGGGAKSAHLAAEAGHGAEHGSDDHGSDDGHGHGESKPKADAHGGGHGASSSDQAQYFKFSREFVIPTTRDGRIEKLIILNISLEANPRASEGLFSREPALRDNIMSTLIALSNDGRTFEALTSVESYETIRSSIQNRLDNLVPGAVQNVLILDIAQQDLPS